MSGLFKSLAALLGSAAFALLILGIWDGSHDTQGRLLATGFVCFLGAGLCGIIADEMWYDE